MPSLLVRSERVALPDGIRPATVQVRDGRIVAVTSHDDRSAGVEVLEAGDAVVLPGLVDTHVHVNDPGRADWEGFEHATRAAAAGGVTTIVDMPLNSIPATTSVHALDIKRRTASGKVWVDVGFWGGVVPGNAGELEPLARAGVLGFKCFLCPSGVPEFEHVTEADLRDGLREIAALHLPLLAHAELPDLLQSPGASEDARAYQTWLKSRPPVSEAAAIDLLVSLASEFNARVHIVHLASADAIPVLRAARQSSANVTVETCPHYLSFAAEDIVEGATAYKCAPPIRSRRHQDGLWRGLSEGDIDLVATDHSPAPPGMKGLMDGDFLKAWGGIASLQVGLSAVWTEASGRGVPLHRLVTWLCEAPARLAGLDDRKGAIAPGKDADLVVWDPEAEWTVDAAKLYHRHSVTPYAGRRLKGRVLRTLLRGQLVFADDACCDTPRGRLLTRKKVLT
jgi:allantoinase